MKLGLLLGYSGADMDDPMQKVLEAERLGFDSVWTSEAWGSDAITPAAWVLAKTSKIKLMPAAFILPWNDPLRIVEKMSMLDALSEGRAVLGMGRGAARRAEG